MTTGDFIKKYKEHYRLSAEKLANLMGFDDKGKNRMEKWIQGKTPSDEEDIDIIREYFAVKKLAQLNEEYLGKLILERVPRETPKEIETSTEFKEEDQPYGKSITELLELLKLEKQSFISQQKHFSQAQEMILKQQDTIQTLADIIKPPNLNDNAKNA